MRFEVAFDPDLGTLALRRAVGGRGWFVQVWRISVYFGAFYGF